MERLRKFAVIMAAVAVVGGVVGGCSDSDSDEATTPADATTIANTAVQTDSEGSTEATDTEAPSDDATTEEPAAGGGDVAAGLSTFEGVCQGCHNNGGQEPGVGPKLAEAGLTEDAVTTVVTEGRGAMPGGLVSGEDLENVTAYVLSIQ